MFPHFTFSGTTYQALHRKLTLFCTCVTQIILLALSTLCVFVAEKNIKQGNETAFLTETSSVISHLQEQDVISHQWLNQLQENSSIQIYLFVFFLINLNHFLLDNERLQCCLFHHSSQFEQSLRDKN